MLKSENSADRLQKELFDRANELLHGLVAQEAPLDVNMVIENPLVQEGVSTDWLISTPALL